MAAPSIPNLNTLKGRGGLRGLRGRANQPRTTEDDQTEDDKAAARDKIIQQTDDDASSSRMSAVALGYLNDPYARAFTTGQIARRYPIINRGTYVRTTAIDRLVDCFLATDRGSRKQIVSLGAGSDTRYFRLKDRTNLVYHEIDFASNTAQKIAVIQRTKALQAIIRASSRSKDLVINADKTALSSSSYHIHALNLRSLASQASPAISNLDRDVPTLLLSECCLCYLDPTTTSAILTSLTTVHISPTTPTALILYEPVRPHDPFGQTMVSNLSSRGIHLQTLKRYYSLRAQRARLKSAGFVDGQGARDIEGIYYGSLVLTGDAAEEWIAEEERARVERLEWLDEVEEWRLLAKHYCVAWGWRDGEGEGEGVFGRAWKEVKGSWTEGERADDEVG